MGNKEILNRSPGKLCGEIKLGINETMLLTRAEREPGGWVGGRMRRGWGLRINFILCFIGQYF